jgi:hypothetical protein
LTNPMDHSSYYYFLWLKANFFLKIKVLLLKMNFSAEALLVRSAGM